MSDDWNRLGAVSSRTDHTCRGVVGTKGCRGCRWFETRLSSRGVDYRLEIIGKSLVPGEVDRIRVETTTSAHAVVDFLSLGEPGKRYIPKVSRKLLHEAAELDEDIGDALDDFDSVTS